MGRGLLYGVLCFLGNLGPLLVAVVGGGVWKMLAGKGGWRKRLHGQFGVYGRCMDRVLKGFFFVMKFNE